MQDLRDGGLRSGRCHGHAHKVGPIGRAGRGGLLLGQRHVPARQGSRARHATSQVNFPVRYRTHEGRVVGGVHSFHAWR